MGPGGYLGAVAPNALFPKKKKKKRTKGSKTLKNYTKLENKQSPELSKVDMVQSLIHPSVSHHPEISSVESKTVLCPRQHLGVFNALPSRHIRSLRDQVCSGGSSMTWDPQVDT